MTRGMAVLRRRFATPIVLLFAAVLLISGCNGKSSAEKSPFSPHWALTTRDVGGTMRSQAGFGSTIDAFGKGNCQLSLQISDTLFALTRLGAPTETTRLTVGGFDVQSQVTQLKGKPANGRGVPISPESTLGQISGGKYRCEQDHAEGKLDERVVYFEVFGKDVNMAPSTGIATNGWRAKLVPPWDQTLNQEGYTLGQQQKLNATEWYEEVWFTITSERTLIILAIQGPRDPAKEFDFQALTNTMVERVIADPPSQSWAQPEPMDW